MKKKLLISYSGGETSAFMTKWLLENKQDEYDMIVVFANTGKENPETLDFVHACDTAFGFDTVWVEAVFSEQRGTGVSARVVTYETASRKGEPFEAMIAKHGIPNINYPHCTRELKERTIKAYLRSIGFKNYYTAIGYRADEGYRINRKKQKRQKQISPLFDEIPLIKPQINLLWAKQPFRLQLKGYQGNCDLCWKKNKAKLITIIQESPEKAQWWAEMEEKYGNYIPEGRKNKNKINLPIHFYRGNTSMKELIAMSEKYFYDVKDDAIAREIYVQSLLYANNGLEKESPCAESCEAFS